MYVIRHSPSGDEAEAETPSAARLAAETLIGDNEGDGYSRILDGADDDARCLGALTRGPVAWEGWGIAIGDEVS